MVGAQVRVRCLLHSFHLPSWCPSGIRHQPSTLHPVWSMTPPHHHPPHPTDTALSPYFRPPTLQFHTRNRHCFSQADWEEGYSSRLSPAPCGQLMPSSSTTFQSPQSKTTSTTWMQITKSTSQTPQPSHPSSTTVSSTETTWHRTKPTTWLLKH